jgi:hypothetical protein
LADTIGIELEVDACEKDVRPFRADILCKDSGTDNWVLIENQVERTDHTHMGQLLTYAAGLQAATIIWSASRFTDEHRAALDWLNEITNDRFHFFGLEVELWRIGNSPPAPKFNIISKPNDWSESVADAASRIERGGLSETRQLQLDFWTGFASYARGNAERIKPIRPSAYHCMRIGVGHRAGYLLAVASMWDSTSSSYDQQELRTELVLSSQDAKTVFAALAAQKSVIEADLGPLVWHNPESARMCRIQSRLQVDLTDRAKWPEYFDWLVKHLDEFHRVFAPRLRLLKSPAPEELPLPA